MSDIPELLDVDHPTIEYFPDVQPIHKNEMTADSFIVTSNKDKELFIQKDSAFKQFYDYTIEFTESSQRKTNYHGLQFKTPAYPQPFITFLARNNWVFKQCAERVANDCIKNGFDITSQNGIEDETDVEAKQEVLDWFNRMPISILDTCHDVIYKYETGGNAGIEIIRENGLNSPLQYLLDFDTENVKLCTDGKRLVQSINGEDTFFVIYGTNYVDGHKQYLNRETGKWSDTPLPKDVEAHEVIWIYRKDRGANEYGVPNIAPGLRIIEMELGRQDFVIDFFINFGMPAWVVSITGQFYDEENKRYLSDGTLNPDFDVTKTIRYKIGQQIQEIIDGGRHGAIVMSFPTSMGQEPVQVTITPLATDVKEASFRGLREDDAEDLCGMMGIDANLILRSKTGAMGNNAVDSILLGHNDNKVKPTQRIINGVLTRLLLFENGSTFIHDISSLKFKLLDYIEQNITENVERDAKLVQQGLMTAREFQTKYSKALGISADGEDELLDMYCINGVPRSVIAERGIITDNDLNRLQQQVTKAGVQFERKQKNILQAKKSANKGPLSIIKKAIRR